MKFARRLRQEVDLWGVVWQQVETFVDRISGAADQDASPRQKVEALLAVASVVERARRPMETRALGAPVLDGLPTTRADESGDSEPISDPWSPEDRTARLPGLDDLELAAGPVSAVDANDEPIDDDLTEVRLMGGRSVPVRVDPRTGVITMGVMPSYDPQATSAASSIVGPTDRLVDIEGDDGDLAGLFSVARRVKATMGTEPDEEHVRTWGDLADCPPRRRRRRHEDPGGPTERRGPGRGARGRGDGDRRRHPSRDHPGRRCVQDSPASSQGLKKI